MPQLELDKLKGNLVAMGEMCEYAISTAMMSLLDRDKELACYMIEYDNEIDEIELSIDRQCQTMVNSGKLSKTECRFVMSASKINNDLERIGDQATHICEHVLFLIMEKSILAQVVDFMPMVEQVCEMTRESINSLLENDPTLAWKIIDERQIVKGEMTLIFRQLVEIMKSEPRNIERSCHILFIAQALLRIADQAANIAEEVISATEGKVVRHHLDEFHPLTLTKSIDMSEEESEEVEKKSIEASPKIDELKRDIKSGKDTALILSKEILEAQASGAVDKAMSAREKLLRHRAKKVTK